MNGIGFQSPSVNGFPSLSCEGLAPTERGAGPAEPMMEIVGSALPFEPQPKPERAPKVVAKQARRLERKAELQRQSKNRQRTSYGRRAGEESWPAFKARIFARDEHKCVVCSRRIGLTPHHLRSVAAGGRNTPENCASLCVFCHDAIHGSGRVNRKQLQAILSARHQYEYTEDAG